MLGVSLDHQLDGSMSVTEPKMLSPSEPEFDLSHLPSELVNLWDFTGDMSWVSRLASRALLRLSMMKLTVCAAIACHVMKKTFHLVGTYDTSDVD